MTSKATVYVFFYLSNYFLFWYEFKKFLFVLIFLPQFDLFVLLCVFFVP